MTTTRKAKITSDELLTTHHWKRISGGREVVDKVTPYIRLHCLGQVPVLLKDGKVWGAGGGEPLDMPEWAGPMIEALTSEGRAKVGF